MSKWEKLIKKLYNIKSDVRFDEIQKILESIGYVMIETKGGSSHVTFRKPNCFPITVPRHGIIKKAYVELVKKAYEEATNHE